MLELIAGAMQSKPGSIIEIGCGFGDTTVELCSIAAHAEYIQKVVGIDPYDQNPEVDPSYNSYPYERFIQKIDDNGCGEYFHLIRKASTDSSVVEDLAPFFPFSSAFIDGVQTKDVVLSDLRLMDQFQVPRLCVDDYGRLTEISQVPLAIQEFIESYPYQMTGLVHYHGRQVAILDRQ